MNTRTEQDLLGSLEIPSDAYYGVHTQRAKQNFNITGVPVGKFGRFVKAFGVVKKAAAIANAQVGVLDETIKDAIVKACDEVCDGKFDDAFIVDMIQGGAGTSTNMNANEVIANRALELMGHQKGDYQHLSPNDHVNLSQSTNDAYPTALHLALDDYTDRLLVALGELRDSFALKGHEFKDKLKMGRTHLQDAVPMTAGQEFSAFATMMDAEINRIKTAQAFLYEINMGATAIGTGLNAPKGYAKACADVLADLTGRPYRTADDLVQATQDTSPYVALSSGLRLLAIRLSKIANDLRLQSSGPRAGLMQYTLPERQAGSSIMPGKVNPVICEVVNQTCFHVIGSDHAIAFASEAGQLQLNVFEPVMAFNLFSSLVMLTNACQTFARLCIDGVMLNESHCHQQVMSNIGLVTALNPHIGYKAATRVALLAKDTGGSVYDIVLEEGLLDEQTLKALTNPDNMVYTT